MKDIGELRSAVHAKDATRAAQALRALTPQDTEAALRYCRDSLTPQTYAETLYHACVWRGTRRNIDPITYDTEHPMKLLSEIGLMAHLTSLTLALHNYTVVHIRGGSSEERILERALERAVHPLRTQYLELVLLPWMRKEALSNESTAHILERVERSMRDRRAWSLFEGDGGSGGVLTALIQSPGIQHAPRLVHQAARGVAQDCASLVRHCAALDVMLEHGPDVSHAEALRSIQLFSPAREVVHATDVLHRLILENLV